MVPNTEKKDHIQKTKDTNEFEKLVAPQADDREYDIIYLNICGQLLWHTCGFYGLYSCFYTMKWATIVFNFILLICANIGITGGSHRLYAHRSYKAKWPLELIYLIFSSIAFQNSAYDWARNHRMHHKYSDTDADPHNATRGFFFSHIGWLLVKKHPTLLKKAKLYDFSDLENNPFLKFQKKYVYIVIGGCCFVLPTLIPWYFWGETLLNAWNLCLFRYVCNLHSIFLINSAAHLWGFKPYDTNIMPTNVNAVSLVCCGEGFHNYHHAFPRDYRASEFGNKTLNLTTRFIDFFAWIGWAYDLKSATDEQIKKKMQTTGDGTDLWGNFIVQKEYRRNKQIN